MFKKTNILKLITLFLLVLALPLIVFVAQKQQEIRQRAEGETIDTLDYFVSTRQDVGLTGTHRLTQLTEGNQSYYVKWSSGNTWEYHFWDDNYIYLKEDRTYNSTNSYTFSNGKWMKRFMQVGETIDVPSSENTIQWYDSNCNKLDSFSGNNSGPFPYKLTLEAHIPNYDIGGDLGIQDVIVLRYQPSPIWEKFYYSKEWGWVKWESADGGLAVFNTVTDRVSPNKSASCATSVPTPNPTSSNPCRNNPVSPPTNYTWKANCSLSCTFNDKCPQNTDQPNYVTPEGSNWCYGFDEGSRCLQLRYNGMQAQTTAVTCKTTLNPFKTKTALAIDLKISGNLSGYKNILCVRDGSIKDHYIGINKRTCTFTNLVPGTTHIMKAYILPQTGSSKKEVVCPGIASTTLR